MSVEMSDVAIQGRSDRSAEVLFEVAEDALLVANDGLPFTRKGVIGICASHLSDKHSYDPNDDFEADNEYLVTAIRHREIATYRNDHNRITSDFSAEDETVHDYGGRFVWELLQNADDAIGIPGRSSGDLIGSKGLGFKAVLEITDEPEIHSSRFHFRFSAARTQRLLRAKRLHSSPPPLTFRIPHKCKPNRKVQELLNEGFATVIRLPFRDELARCRDSRR